MCASSATSPSLTHTHTMPYRLHVPPWDCWRPSLDGHRPSQASPPWLAASATCAWPPRPAAPPPTSTEHSPSDPAAPQRRPWRIRLRGAAVPPGGFQEESPGWRRAAAWHPSAVPRRSHAEFLQSSQGHARRGPEWRSARLLDFYSIHSLKNSWKWIGLAPKRPLFLYTSKVKRPERTKAHTGAIGSTRIEWTSTPLCHGTPQTYPSTHQGPKIPCMFTLSISIILPPSPTRPLHPFLSRPPLHPNSTSAPLTLAAIKAS